MCLDGWESIRTICIYSMKVSIKCLSANSFSYKCTLRSIFGPCLCLKLTNTLFMRICHEFENWRDLHVLSGKFLRQKSCYLESFCWLFFLTLRANQYGSSERHKWSWTLISRSLCIIITTIWSLILLLREASYMWIMIAERRTRDHVHQYHSHHTYVKIK